MNSKNIISKSLTTKNIISKSLTTKNIISKSLTTKNLTIMHKDKNVIKKFVLYVYNLNYKVKIKWIKYELNKIISRKVKSFKIRMNNKMEGQAFIEFTNKNDMVECNKILDGLFLHNRKIISSEAIKKR